MSRLWYPDVRTYRSNYVQQAISREAHPQLPSRPERPMTTNKLSLRSIAQFQSVALRDYRIQNIKYDCRLLLVMVSFKRQIILLGSTTPKKAAQLAFPQRSCGAYTSGIMG